MTSFRDRFHGEAYFELRATEVRLRRDFVRLKAQELGVSLAQISLITTVCSPIKYSTDSEQRLFGADTISASNLAGPIEISDHINPNSYRPDGRFVCPIAHGELDAVTVYMDATKDGSPYMPDDIADEGVDSSGLLIVVPRPRPQKVVVWPHPFVMAEDTFVNARSRTPLRDYLAGFGVSIVAENGIKPADASRVPATLSAEDVASIVSLSAQLEVNTSESAFRVLDPVELPSKPNEQ